MSGLSNKENQPPGGSGMNSNGKRQASSLTWGPPMQKQYVFQLPSFKSCNQCLTVRSLPTGDEPIPSSAMAVILGGQFGRSVVSKRCSPTASLVLCSWNSVASQKKNYHPGELVQMDTRLPIPSLHLLYCIQFSPASKPSNACI